MRSIGIDWKNEKRTEKKPNKGINKQAEAAGPRERRWVQRGEDIWIEKDGAIADDDTSIEPLTKGCL